MSCFTVDIMLMALPTHLLWPAVLLLSGSDSCRPYDMVRPPARHPLQQQRERAGFRTPLSAADASASIEPTPVTASPRSDLSKSLRPGLARAAAPPQPAPFRRAPRLWCAEAREFVNQGQQ